MRRRNDIHRLVARGLLPLWWGATAIVIPKLGHYCLMKGVHRCCHDFIITGEKIVILGQWIILTRKWVVLSGEQVVAQRERVLALGEQVFLDKQTSQWVDWEKGQYLMSREEKATIVPRWHVAMPHYDTHHFGAMHPLSRAVTMQWCFNSRMFQPLSRSRLRFRIVVQIYASSIIIWFTFHSSSTLLYWERK